MKPSFARWNCYGPKSGVPIYWFTKLGWHDGNDSSLFAPPMTVPPKGGFTRSEAKGGFVLQSTYSTLAKAVLACTSLLGLNSTFKQASTSWNLRQFLTHGSSSALSQQGAVQAELLSFVLAAQMSTNPSNKNVSAPLDLSLIHI